MGYRTSRTSTASLRGSTCGSRRQWGSGRNDTCRKYRGRRTTQGPVNAPQDKLSSVKFLTVAEVAAVMRVSKMTVYRMVHAGELPAVRVGRSFRVPATAVHDYLQSAFIDTA